MHLCNSNKLVGWRFCFEKIEHDKNKKRIKTNGNFNLIGNNPLAGILMLVIKDKDLMEVDQKNLAEVDQKNLAVVDQKDL